MHAGEGIFVSNRAFLCRTGLFCVEPCILLSNQAFLCRTSVIIYHRSLWAGVQCPVGASINCRQWSINAHPRDTHNGNEWDKQHRFVTSTNSICISSLIYSWKPNEKWWKTLQIFYTWELTRHQHIEAWAKWPTFSQTIFSRIFFHQNVCIFILISPKFVPTSPIKQYVRTAWGNGLVQNHWYKCLKLKFSHSRLKTPNKFPSLFNLS